MWGAKTTLFRRITKALHLERRRKRRGFTMIEILLAVGLISALGSMSVPMYQEYRIRSDLYLAEDIVTQALYRARLLSQTGEQDSQWSYNVDEGIVYKGTDFDSRDTTFDESFTLPRSIEATGLSEITFSRVHGVPSPDGDIVLESVSGEKRWVSISPDTAIAGDGVPPARFKVIFERLDNPKNGQKARNVVFVGPDPTEYPEGQWISLEGDDDIGVECSGDDDDDEQCTYDEPGIYVRRQAGVLQVWHYGGSQPGHIIRIDADIIVDNATMTDVENDASPYDTENPFDGNESNGVGGDEVTTAGDNASVLFQTRETNSWDGILVHWE